MNGRNQIIGSRVDRTIGSSGFLRIFIYTDDLFIGWVRSS